jgi:hypothetical protein
MMVDDGTGWLIEDEIPTQPGLGIPRQQLLIKEEHVTLFYSISWNLSAVVNQEVIASSQPRDRQYTEAEKACWVLWLLNKYKNYLETLGVDVEDELCKWSGC